MKTFDIENIKYFSFNDPQQTENLKCNVIDEKRRFLRPKKRQN